MLSSRYKSRAQKEPVMPRVCALLRRCQFTAAGLLLYLADPPACAHCFVPVGEVAAMNSVTAKTIGQAGAVSPARMEKGTPAKAPEETTAEAETAGEASSPSDESLLEELAAGGDSGSGKRSISTATGREMR